MRRDRKACVEAKQVRSPGIRPMVLQRQFPKVPLVGGYPSLGLRGILIFFLPSYNQSGERMVSISWNPSSFSLYYFPSYFPYDFYD
jgi:hypothetical protein